MRILTNGRDLRCRSEEGCVKLGGVERGLL